MPIVIRTDNISDWNLTRKSLKAFATDDIPNFDGRVGISWDKNVIAKLHSGREGLMTHQCMFTGTSFRVPDTDASVQWTTYYVDSIELIIKVKYTLTMFIKDFIAR